MRLAVVVPVLLAGCRLGFGSDDAAARVERGTVVVDATQTGVTVPIAPVVREHAFVVFGVAVDSVQPQDGLFTGRIASESELRFERGMPGPAATITWQVLELDSGMTVQHGGMTTPENVSTVVQPIVEAPLGESFVLVSWTQDAGTEYDNNDFLSARLVDATTLELRSGFAVGSPTPPDLPDQIQWQIVTIAGTRVQSGETTLGAVDTTVAATLQPVDLAHTLVFFTWWLDSDTASIGRYCLHAALSEAELAFDRGATGASVTAEWFVVEWDRATVAADSAVVASGENLVNVPLGAFDPASSLVLLPAAQHYAATPLVGLSPDDRLGVALFTAEAIGSTLRLSRASTLATATVGWSVATF
jgi:hypothetical protein